MVRVFSLRVHVVFMSACHRVLASGGFLLIHSFGSLDTLS
jgi:hypothetical protein